MLEACGESSVLIESVGTIVGENVTQGEQFFVVTEVDSDRTNLVEISGVDKLDGDDSIEENQCWAEICRVCANSSDHLIPIFEGEGLEHEISSKIQRYLPIQVSKVFLISYLRLITRRVEFLITEECFSALRFPRKTIFPFICVITAPPPC